MSDYFNVTTNNGDAAIATAIANNTKLNITHIAFGDGNGAVPTPNKARTTLVNEVYRQVIAKYEPHPTIANYLIVEVVIPSEIGGFWIREIGLIADGILISHGSHAPFFKVAESDGVSEFHLKYTINIQDGGVVDLTLDESLIYATEAWVDENYVPRDEIVNNLTTDESEKPLSAAQGKKLQDEKFAITDLVNDLTTGGIKKGLSAEQGKILYGMFAAVLSTNGYQKLPNINNPSKPLIIQWGEIPAQDMVNSQNGNQSFPISFTTACFSVVIGSTMGTIASNSDEGFYCRNKTLSGFGWTSAWQARTSVQGVINYLAIGY